MTRVLVVEGGPGRAGVLADILKSAGSEVIAVDSASEALRASATEAIDLVVTDWSLADGSGLELCRAVRARDVGRRIPVLLHSSLTAVDQVLAGLAAGADGYLADDLPPAAVMARIETVLASQRTAPNVNLLNSDASEQEIKLRFLHHDYQIHASREQLLAVLVSALEDLVRANERHEDELNRRREAEQKLRDSEALYESLVETLPMNLFRKDREGRVTFCNQRYCHSRGSTFDQMLGKTDYDLFPRELADKYTADDRRVMETGEVFECIESHVGVGGEKQYAHVLKTPVYDAEAHVIGTQGIFWDVTARRRAEEALEQQRYLLTTLMDNVPDNIFFKDREGRYLRVNLAMARRLGFEDPSEVIGKTAFDLFPLEYATRIHQCDQYVMSTGQSVIGEEESVRWADGIERWVLITRMPLRAPDGTITGSFGLSHNITDQKRAQQAMREARDVAEAASAAKSNFLANMSHEIRTPMNAIIGMTELVLDTPLTETQRDYLKMVQESGESLLGVINDILDFSKIEAGKLELERRTFQLRESLGDTLKSLAVRAHRGHLELACHVAPDVPEHLIGDAGRLRQVVVNLVGNSIKFTDMGEVVVAVCLESAVPDPASNGQESESNHSQRVALHFSIRDTGIGIPADKLGKIFEAFEQVDTSMTRRYEGTGLGLAISSRLVELMNGRMWVDSELGCGSTFHFVAAFDVPFAIEPRERDAAGLAGRRILVVDDNATNRRILDEILRNWLVQPVLVDSAVHALEALEAACGAGRPFDLVLTDANMPEMDGFQLVERLQSCPQLAGPVIMMLTSSGRIGDLARCSELGIASYLIKPIKQSELFDAIVEVLGVREVEDAHVKSSDLPNQHSRTLNVLLVEDSQVNQKLAIGLLRKWGHHVTVANNGREALEMSGERRFDVLLMDVQMPEMDGLEATRRIRSREAGAEDHVPIIAMTAHALKGDEERCLAAGMDAYVTKPIRAPVLFSKLAAVCDASITGAPQCSNGTDGRACSSQLPQIAERLIDWARALEIVGGDHDLLREVVSAVLQECPSQTGLLNQSLTISDAATARRAAHTIHGNMRAIGAERPMQCSAHVEQLTKGGQFDGVQTAMAELNGLLAQVYSEINEYLKLPAS